jgi:glycosyltransferase involved in cell wall biosynthesis
VTSLPTVIIQIACLDEAETLPATIADLPTSLPGVGRLEYLVVDDGSTDETVRVARDCGVHHIVSHDRNRGLAAAFLTGLDHALRLGADVVVHTDADNQYAGADVAKLVEPVLAGRADLVVGERPIESIEGFSRTKKLLQRVGSRVVRFFSGTEVRDAASGFRAMSREAALRLHVFGRYTYTMETLIQAGWEGLTVTSVPISVNPATRPSRLVRSIPQYLWRSSQAIVRAFVLYKPFRFFALLGAVPMLLGVALLARWLLLYAIEDEYTSRLPSLLTGIGCVLVAVQLWAVAFLADLQAANRRLVADVRVRMRARELAGADDVEIVLNNPVLEPVRRTS